jgi:pimeloyl-ACP methyl ester carboxylesterase
MLYQNWIAGEDSSLLSVHHWPANRIALGSVILLSGFSHPMCDMDYLMSKLARQLSDCGFFVAQVDLRGHGDSGGDFKEVDLVSLQEDIDTVIQYYSNRYTDNLYCVGRGLAASLLIKLAPTHCAGVAGISPYCLNPRALAGHIAWHSNETVDATDVFQGHDYVTFSDFDHAMVTLLNALGTVPYNLHGMEISTRFLAQLAEFDPLAAFKENDKFNSLWLFPNSITPNLVDIVRFDESSRYPATDVYSNESFVRNPKVQQKYISTVINWVAESCQSQ